VGDGAKRTVTDIEEILSPPAIQGKTGR